MPLSAIANATGYGTLHTGSPANRPLFGAPCRPTTASSRTTDALPTVLRQRTWFCTAKSLLSTISSVDKHDIHTQQAALNV